MASVVEMEAVELRHQLLRTIEELKPIAAKLRHLADCLPRNPQGAEIRDDVTTLLWRLAQLENRAAAI